MRHLDARLRVDQRRLLALLVHQSMRKLFPLLANNRARLGEPRPRARVIANLESRRRLLPQCLHCRIVGAQASYVVKKLQMLLGDLHETVLQLALLDRSLAEQREELGDRLDTQVARSLLLCHHAPQQALHRQVLSTIRYPSLNARAYWKS